MSCSFNSQLSFVFCSKIKLPILPTARKTGNISLASVIRSTKSLKGEYQREREGEGEREQDQASKRLPRKSGQLALHLQTDCSVLVYQAPDCCATPGPQDPVSTGMGGSAGPHGRSLLSKRTAVDVHLLKSLLTHTLGH